MSDLIDVHVTRKVDKSWVGKAITGDGNKARGMAAELATVQQATVDQYLAEVEKRYLAEVEKLGNPKALPLFKVGWTITAHGEEFNWNPLYMPVPAEDSEITFRITEINAS